ncbi:MAG: cysteine--tRNA ligase [Nitrososphaerales archaeon]|nr:cysteine--tRNA ligase [Nitrososphaerales archaeon]
MGLRVYNTLKRKKEDFKPIDGKKVKMFVCGPTVYDLSHLGHARTYVAYDVIARWLRYRGYDLFYLMNITDIDDKIIKRANEKRMDPLDLAKELEESFFKDMKSLGINSISFYARASDHISEIIDQIRRLLEKGFAYSVETGIYFDVSKFEDYGKLSHQNPEELKKHRIEPDPHKRTIQDFSLWKRRREREPSWGSPWGEGRPGWHIEDTAIAEKYLGQQYDIHGGGIDLVFPHHEAEIAQMESISGKKPMVKYWLHTGFLKVKGRKMAKSLGNFIMIQDALNNHDAETLRLFFSSTHYRSPIDFYEKRLKQTINSLESLDATLDKVRRVKKRSTRFTEEEDDLERRIEKSKKEFEEAMDDDFNTPLALTHLYGLATDVNKLLNKQRSINDRLADRLVSTFKELGGVLGILQKEEKEEELPEKLIMLIDERERARIKKDWRTADEIRKRLKGFGIILEDTEEGVRWKKK